MPAFSYKPINSRAFAIVASRSKLSRASTSVETRPGTIFRISMPKLTASRSMNASVRFASPTAGCAIGIRQRRFDERAVLRLLRRLQQQRRVGRRVLRPELAHRLDVAGIGNDGGELLERVEQGHANRITEVTGTDEVFEDRRRTGSSRRGIASRVTRKP